MTLQAQAPAEPDNLDDDEHLPRKRRRTAPPHSQLIDAALASPARWGPVLAAMLQLHGHSLPAAAFQTALAGVTTQLEHAFAVVGSAVSGSAGPSSGGQVQAASQRLLWLLRIAHELAVAWPAQLHPAAHSQASSAGCGGRGSPGLTASEDAQDWQHMWTMLVDALSVDHIDVNRDQATAVPANCTDAMLWLMQALLHQRLVTVAAKAALAARFAPLNIPPFNHAALALLAALFEGEPCSSQHDADARDWLLSYCVQSLEYAFETSGTLGPLLAAVSAVMGGHRAHIAAAAADLAGEGGASSPAVGDLPVPTVTGETAQWWYVDGDTARLDVQMRDLGSTQELLARRLAHTLRRQLVQLLDAAELQRSGDTSSSSSASGSSQHGDAQQGTVTLARQLQGWLASKYADRLKHTLQSLVAGLNDADGTDERTVILVLAACMAATAAVADAQQLPVAVGEDNAFVALLQMLVDALLQAGTAIKVGLKLMHCHFCYSAS